MYRDLYLRRFLDRNRDTEISDEIALYAEMLKLFGIFERHIDDSTHIIIFVVDRQFNFFFSLSNLMILLILFGIKFDIDLNGASEPSKEGCNFFLNS